jgi:hypothetical protein
MFPIYWVDKGLIIGLVIVSSCCCSAIARTIPNNPTFLNKVEDIPEEVLRSQIYTEARSPLDGKLLSAAEYIELEEQLNETIANIPPRLLVSEKMQQLIDLLKLRKLIRQVIPFF